LYAVTALKAVHLLLIIWSEFHSSINSFLKRLSLPSVLPNARNLSKKNPALSNYE